MADLCTEVVNNTHALVVVVDAEGRVVLFNRACERLTGYRFEEIRGLPFWELPLLLPDESGSAMVFFEKLKDGQCAHAQEIHYVAKSGERRCVEWSFAPLTDASGRSVHAIGTGIDVTETRAVEVALRNTEQRQRTLLDSIPDAAWLMDADGRYVAVNRTYAERWGFDRSNAIGKTIFDIVPAPLSERIDAENRAVMDTGVQLHIERRRMVDGQDRWFDVTKTPIFDDSVKLIGIAAISRDITERKLAEARRMAHDAGLRAALIKDVHHRIKNNLQGVITFIQQLTSHQPGNTSLVEAVIGRVNAIASVYGLVGTLGENNHRLEDILLTLVSSLKTIHPDLPLRLSICSGLGSVRVLAGETLPLALVVNELIMNAVKHAPGPAEGNSVEISLESTADCSSIAVCSRRGRFPAQFDFGSGAGLGTGLALVKSLLPPAGAKLRFENLDPPGGTKVELILRPPVTTSG